MQAHIKATSGEIGSGSGLGALAMINFLEAKRGAKLIRESTLLDHWRASVPEADLDLLPPGEAS